MMPKDPTEQLLNAAMTSNDGKLCGLAMQAAERLKSREEDIADLRAQLAEARLSEIAALGQAQDAHTAQLEAEARAIRVGEAVREAAIKRVELLLLGRSRVVEQQITKAIRALDVAEIAAADPQRDRRER